MKKNGVKELLYRLIYPTALYFTVITVILYAAGAAISYGNTNLIPTLETIFTVLAFSFMLSLANLLLSYQKLNFAFRIALHYIITSVSFIVLFITASGKDPRSSITLILFLLYALVYAAVCSAILLTKSAKRKSEIKSSEYNSIYDKKI